MNFAWDVNKAEMNLKKHGVSFDEATTVFNDEKAILFDDPEHSSDECRFILLGLSNILNILIVCHCYRGDGDVIRIISARKATKNEIKQYNSFNKGEI